MDQVPPETSCSACGRRVISRWEIDQHNIACATNGERAYPRPPKIIRERV